LVLFNEFYSVGTACIKVHFREIYNQWNAAGAALAVKMAANAEDFYPDRKLG
jgi:hypothetical protein